MDAVIGFLGTSLGRNTLKTVGVLIITGICYLLGWKVILTILLIIFLVVRWFSLFATFPAAGYLSRKSFERDWEIGEAQQIHAFCMGILEVISCCQEQRSDKQVTEKLRQRLFAFDEVRVLCMHFQEYKSSFQLDEKVIRQREQIRRVWNLLETITLASSDETSVPNQFPLEYQEEIKLINLLEYYSRLAPKQQVRAKKFRFRNFREYEPVSEQVQLLLNDVEEVMKQGGICADLKKKFFSPRVTGSMQELRIQQTHRRPLVRLQLPVSYFTKIDSILMLPKIANESEIAQMERIKSIEQYLYDTKILNSNLKNATESTLEQATAGRTCNTHNEVVLFYCNPNAGTYETLDLGERYLIDTLTGTFKGYLFAWNYRGYGASTGGPSMQNLVDDGIQIMKFLKHGLKFAKVIMWGRSIGGHVCKSLAEHADAVVIDRSFNIISSVPRNMFKKAWVQQAYEMLLGPHPAGVEEYCHSKVPKILLTSLQKDEVIPCFGSIHTAVTAELTDLAYSSKPATLKYYKELKRMRRWKGKIPLLKRYMNAAMHTSYSGWIESHISRISDFIIPSHVTSEVHAILSSLVCQIVNIHSQREKEAQERDQPPASQFDEIPPLPKESDSGSNSENESTNPGDTSSVELTGTRDQSLMNEDTGALGDSDKPHKGGRKDYFSALCTLTGDSASSDRLNELINYLSQAVCGSIHLGQIYMQQGQEGELLEPNYSMLQLWIVDAVVWGISVQEQETAQVRLNGFYLGRLAGLENLLERIGDLITQSLPILKAALQTSKESDPGETGLLLIEDLHKVANFLYCIAWRVMTTRRVMSGDPNANLPDKIGIDDTKAFCHFIKKLKDSKFLELRSQFIEVDMACSHNKEVNSNVTNKVLTQVMTSVLNKDLSPHLPGPGLTTTILESYEGSYTH